MLYDGAQTLPNLKKLQASPSRPPFDVVMMDEPGTIIAAQENLLEPLQPSRVKNLAKLSPGAIVIFNVGGFLLGIAAVWLYAAIRPRYGSGPNTAIRAGLVAWAIAVFLPNLGNYPLGLFPTRLLLISTVVALVEIVVATLVGAWLYKEEEKVAAVRPIAA